MARGRRAEGGEFDKAMIALTVVQFTNKFFKQRMGEAAGSMMAETFLEELGEYGRERGV